MKSAIFLLFSTCRFSTCEKTPFQETKWGAQGEKRRSHCLLALRVTTACVPYLPMFPYSTHLLFQVFFHLCGQDRFHCRQAGVTNGTAWSLRHFLEGSLPGVLLAWYPEFGQRVHPCHTASPSILWSVFLGCFSALHLPDMVSLPVGIWSSVNSNIMKYWELVNCCLWYFKQHTIILPIWQMSK